MSDVAPVIDAVIREGLGASLKAAGFSKSGRNFRRSLGESLQVINVQASTFNSSASGRFTVNLGAYYPGLADILEQPLGKPWPTEYQCHIRKRIGTLMPAGRDTWWDVDTGSDIGALANDLETSVVEYGLPWLAGVSTLTGAQTQPSSPVHAAAIALALGKQEEAVRLFAPLLTRDHPLSDTLMRWALRHNLIEA